MRSSKKIASRLRSIMKLLVVSSWFPSPPDNGSKMRAFHLLEQLAQRHSLTLLSFTETDDRSGAAVLERMCRRVRTVAGNPYKVRGALRSRGLLTVVPRSYAQTYSTEMQALVDAEVPDHDAAVALGIGSAIYLTPHFGLARVFEEAEISVARDAYRRAAGARRLRRGLTWWKLRRFVRLVVNGCERTTVVSEDERRNLIEADCDPSKVKVVPNGVNRADLQRTNCPRPGRLIYPGSVTYAANLDAVRYFASEILPLIRTARPGASLTVTGSTEGVDLQNIRDSGVTFTGLVPDVKRLVSHSAVCVVPLRIGGGTRLKILEAMALGTPVVATSKGAEGLGVTPGDNILIADSPAEFAAQVIRILDDFVLRARLAASGRRLVERLYTWDRIGTELDQVVAEAVEEHRRRNSASHGRHAPLAAAPLHL